MNENEKFQLIVTLLDDGSVRIDAKGNLSGRELVKIANGTDKFFTDIESLCAVNKIETGDDTATIDGTSTY